MLFIITILGITAIIVVVVRFLLRNVSRPYRRTGVTIAGAVVGVAGIVLAITAFDRLAERIGQGDWPTTEGRVVSSTVIGERSFVPEIKYEYTIAGERFTGTSDRNVPLFGTKRRDYDVAKKEAAQYPAGTAVTVYYNPEDPAESAIMPEPRWNDYAQTGFGVFLFGVGLFLVIWPRKRD